jgi:hypothetical protein
MSKNAAASATERVHSRSTAFDLTAIRSPHHRGARAMPIAGQIEMFAFSKVSDDWVPCNGQLLRGSDYWELLKLLQAAYGGEPPETFAVPNLPPPTPAGPLYFIYAGEWSGSHRGRRP